MEINFSAALPSSSTEPVSVSADQEGDVPETSFLDHMDRVLQSSCPPDGAAEEKEEGQKSAKAASDAPDMLINLPIVPIELQERTVPGAIQFKGESGEDAAGSNQSQRNLDVNSPAEDIDIFRIQAEGANGKSQLKAGASNGMDQAKFFWDSLNSSNTDSSAVITAGNQILPSETGIAFLTGNESSQRVPAAGNEFKGLEPDPKLLSAETSSAAAAASVMNTENHGGATVNANTETELSGREGKSWEAAFKSLRIVGESPDSKERASADQAVSLSTDMVRKLDSRDEKSNAAQNSVKQENQARNGGDAVEMKAYRTANAAEPALAAPEAAAFSSILTELRGKMEVSSKVQNGNGNPAMSEDFRLSADSAAGANTARPENSQTFVQAVSENADASHSRANQENKGNPFSFTMPQNRTDNSHPDVAKVKNPGTERLQESSPQLASVAGRLSATGNAKAAPPETGLHSSDFITQIAERMQIQLRDGKGEIRIQLKPDSLGRLEIAAENTSHGVVARIVAESSTVKTYLEGNLHSLQQALQDQGLRVDRIQVTVQENNGFQSSSGHAGGPGQSGSGNHGKGNGRFTDNPENYPDELTVDVAAWIRLNPNSRFYTIA